MTDSTPIPMDSRHDANSQDESERLGAHMQRQAEEQFQRHMMLAAQLLTRGYAEQALPLLRNCYTLHPENVDVLTNLGGAHIMTGQFDEAVALLERAVEQVPHSAALWSNLAAAYLGRMYTADRTRQEKALAAYRRAAEIEPHYPNVHYHMGLIHIERREWVDAHAAFSLALESRPDDDDARNMLARVVQVLNAPPKPENN